MAALAGHSLRWRIEQLMRIDPVSKPKVYWQVFESAELFSLNYWLELVFAASIATFGLVLNSPAVVIGAMLTSPLMGPIMAAGLALAAADLYLGVKAIVTIAISVLVAVAFSAALVWLIPFDEPTAEILNRTQPNLLDLGVALASGLAGAAIVCRGGTGGGVTALPGVAIAVALMPPLCTVGFGVGIGFQPDIVYGASLLFVTNLAAIIASAFLIFFVVRMDAPDVRLEIDRTIMSAAPKDALYRLLERTALSRQLGKIGKLRWRVLMVLSVLALLFFPLKEGLMRVRQETIARGAVREGLQAIAGPDVLVSQHVQFDRSRIRIWLVATEPIPPGKIKQAERIIRARTGKETEISARKVAGESELAMLRARLQAPTPVPPEPRAIDQIRTDVLGRIEEPLQAVWPFATATLVGYEVGFAPAGVVARISYQADKPLGAAAEEMLRRALQTALGAATLDLILDHRPTPKLAANAKRRKK